MENEKPLSPFQEYINGLGKLLTVPVRPGKRTLSFVGRN
jgi:hypothetical protein